MSYKAECRNTSVYQSVCNFTQPGLTDLYGTCLILEQLCFDVTIRLRPSDTDESVQGM